MLPVCFDRKSYTPVRNGARPVNSAARDGEQLGAPAYACVKRTADAKKASTCGVRTNGCRAFRVAQSSVVEEDEQDVGRGGSDVAAAGSSRAPAPRHEDKCGSHQAKRRPPPELPALPAQNSSYLKYES